MALNRRWPSVSCSEVGSVTPTEAPSFMMSVDDLGVSRDSCTDLVTSHEAVGIVAVVRPAGKRRGPVRGDEPKIVPPVQPAAAEVLATVDHQVLALRFTEEPRHRETGVTGADHENVDVVRQRANSGRSRHLDHSPLRAFFEVSGEGTS
jgi:hypothetical protein